MKSFTQRIIRWLLIRFAESIVRIYQPYIIAITGSVGKTSTKQAIAALLFGKEGVRVSKGNLNTEFGVPFTIIGVENPNGSPLKWMSLFLRAFSVFFLHQSDYPKTLVLEMGADRSGDIELLTKIAPPDIAVLTAISSVHLERLGSIGEVAREKSWILRRLNPNGLAVIAEREQKAWGLSKLTAAKTLTYGLEQDAQVRASDIHYRTVAQAGRPRGTMFKLHYQGSSVPCLLVDAVGQGAVEAALAAAAVGTRLGMNLLEIIEQLRFAHFPPGRAHIISGIKQTIIIDDTYNASPKAARVALEVLSNIAQEEGRRTWAVLGDMVDLGAQTEEEHRRIGKVVVETKPSRLVVVGPASRWIADEAEHLGYPNERIVKFSEAREAGRVLQDLIETGDCLLVKGSELMRMERIVKELMLDPQHAESLLVRQDLRWLSR